MAIANVALTDTFDNWRTRTNQLAVIATQLTDTGFSTPAAITLTGTGKALNVSSGYISANGIGITNIQNTSISGTFKNNQLQNSSINFVAATGLRVSSASISLGGTLTITPNISTSVSDTSTSNLASASAVNTVHAIASTLGTLGTQSNSAVNITGGSITGITDLPVADGGTGASTAAGARTNLGLGYIATLNTLTYANTSFSGYNGFGARTVSTSDPSGGNDGDIWYKVDS
jgi:hypothetical protein